MFITMKMKLKQCIWMNKELFFFVHPNTQSVSLCGLLHDIDKKSYPFMVHPLLPVPRLYRKLGVIPG